MEEQIGSLLQSAPHIVERILRGLSARDVQRVSRVCRTWQKYAAIVLKERRRVMTMTAEKLDQLDYRVAIMDNPKIKEFLRNLDIECGCAIVFQDSNRRSHRFVDLFVADYSSMHSYLPPSFTAICAMSISGIIGTSIDGSLCLNKCWTTPFLSAYLLPKSPIEGTLIKHFSLAANHAYELENTDLNMSTLAEALRWPNSEGMKCIVLLEDQDSLECHLWNGVQTLLGGQLALAGGIICKIYSSTYSVEEKEWGAEDVNDDINGTPKYTGLVFGGENVRATSLVIEGGTAKEAENRLQKLKELVDGWGECRQKIAFMFANSIRRRLSNVDGLEANIFRRLMPDIPLNGIFTIGELGWDYPPPITLQPTKKSELANNAFHEYTTTIAVVGFM